MRLSRQLAGAKNRRSRRLIDKVARCRTLRSAADASRIEDIRLIAVESEEIVRASLAEVSEDIGAFEKERSLLRKEGFKSAEIDDRRIHFNLTKIRIHRGI